MNTQEIAQQYFNSLRKLAHWKTVFVSWQLGTRLQTDPECQAVKDHREATILLRCEVTAFTNILIKKGFFTLQELQLAVAEEAEHLNEDYQRMFPGMKATATGIDIDVEQAQETMKGWRP